MKTLNAKKLIPAIGGKALVIPKEGWTADSFARYGAAMLATLHRTARIVQRQQASIVANECLRLFNRQMNLVIANLLQRSTFGRGASGPMVKVSAEFILPDEGLWLEAIREVMAETDTEITARIVSPIQSTVAQGYSKTSILLAQTPNEWRNVDLARQARDIAVRVRRVNQTTRAVLERTIRGAIKEGMTVGETAELIRNRVPKINGSRALTIARTETNAAWTKGTITALKESATVTQVSVIGCESREEDRWDDPSYQQYLYNGESTCNIQDVPIGDADKLEWHINHTGNIIPSGFADV